jgi:hypothetical protein
LENSVTLQGTIISGRVELDSPANLPNGTRVRVELLDDNLDPPLTPEDHEAEIAALRESLQDAADGRGTEAREFLKRVALKHKLPLASGE